nr:unnamed protein product [Digitaria exilis]
MLLLTNGAGKVAIAEKIGGDQCYSVYHSNTFKGPCVTDPPCIAACAREGRPGGLCFFDVGHRVCICTAPCPPPPATTSSRGDTV